MLGVWTTLRSRKANNNNKPNSALCYVHIKGGEALCVNYDDSKINVDITTKNCSTGIIMDTLN